MNDELTEAFVNPADDSSYRPNILAFFPFLISPSKWMLLNTQISFSRLRKQKYTQLITTAVISLMFQ